MCINRFHSVTDALGTSGSHCERERIPRGAVRISPNAASSLCGRGCLAADLADRVVVLCGLPFWRGVVCFDDAPARSAVRLRARRNWPGSTAVAARVRGIVRNLSRRLFRIH